jgi:hypothetical protein
MDLTRFNNFFYNFLSKIDTYKIKNQLNIKANGEKIKSK